MGADFTSSVITFSGKRYSFVATLNKDLSESNYLNLDCGKISFFQYENELNKLCLSGKLIYTDIEGKVINYLHDTVLYMLVSLAKLDEQENGGVKTEVQSKTEKFEYAFLVNNIEILQRSGSNITYCFHLISKNYLNFQAKVHYSNYNDKKLPVLSILNQCLVQNQRDDYTTNVSSFLCCMNGPEIYYTTHANDDAFSVSKYLLNKQFYYEEKADSIKFLKYDEYTNKYSIFDAAKIEVPELSSDYDYVIVSMFKNKEEEITYQVPNNFKSTAIYPKTRLYKDLFDTTVYDYDYNTNVIYPIQISSETIASYYNEFGDNEDRKDKKLDTLPELDLNYTTYSSYWNNDFRYYSNLCQDLIGDNALVVTTVANILRRPGDAIMIAIPKNPQDNPSDSPNAYENFNERYDKIQGEWIIGKVVNMLSPTQSTYMQNLTIFKNFKEKKQ